MTNYSGCLIEAFQLSVPSVLISEIGKEMFEQYINYRLVSFLDQNSQNFEIEVTALVKKCSSYDFKSKCLKVFNPLG